MKFFIQTYGCQMNEHDSEVLSDMLIKSGHIPSPEIENSDIIMINTCSIREHAEQRVYGRIGELKKFKHANPELIIGIIGCMAEKDNRKIISIAEHVDFVAGPNKILKIPEIIEQISEKRTHILITGSNSEGYSLPARENLTNKIKSYVSIMQGCDNYCSYCVVPYVRGNQKSRQIGEILNEVRNLQKKGVKEICLIGQNVNSYGSDFGNGVSFPKLLKEVDSEVDCRIRFTTSHPKDFNREIIDAVADSKHVCSHFHVPVQSGSDRILKLMNRRYTSGEYAGKMEMLKTALKEYSVSTDIIVGFPTETEKDFGDTLKLVDNVGFDNAFAFIYSPRPNTEAYSLEDDVPRQVKVERLKVLTDKISERVLKSNKNSVGRIEETLFDAKSPKDPGRIMGRTALNRVVSVEDDGSNLGAERKVEITGYDSWTLLGRIVSAIAIFALFFTNVYGQNEESLYKYSMELYRMKNAKETKKAFGKFLAMYPVSEKAPEVSFRQASLEDDCGNALIQYRRTVELYPETQWAKLAVYNLGRIYYIKGEYGNSRNELKKLLNEYSSLELYGEVLKLLGLSQLQTGEIESALETFVELERTSVEQADFALLMQGNCLLKEKDFNGALDKYRILMQKYPSSSYFSEALLKTGDCFIAQSDGKEAEKYYKEVILKFPKSFSAKIAERRLSKT